MVALIEISRVVGNPPGYRNSLGMTEEQIKQYADGVVGNIPLGRTETLDEVAKVVSFLAWNESS
jgi:hypothetical protein